MRDTEHIVERLAVRSRKSSATSPTTASATATEDGDADALADEKKVLQARRAIERAIVALSANATRVDDASS